MKLTKAKKLAVLKRAKKIISDPSRWTHGALRKKEGRKYTYCLLGACEKAAYDLGYATPGPDAFAESAPLGKKPFGYQVGHDLSLENFAARTRYTSAYRVNDGMGREAAVKLLDDYVTELETKKKPVKKGA